MNSYNAVPPPPFLYTNSSETHVNSSSSGHGKGRNTSKQKWDFNKSEKSSPSVDEYAPDGVKKKKTHVKKNPRVQPVDSPQQDKKLDDPDSVQSKPISSKTKEKGLPNNKHSNTQDADFQNSTANSSPASPSLASSASPASRPHLPSNLNPPSASKTLHKSKEVGDGSNPNTVLYELSPVKKIPTKNFLHFPNYVSIAEAELGIKNGRYFKGVFRVNAYNRSEAYVSLEGLENDVLIPGMLAQNRAVEGDIVAIEIDPFDLWSSIKQSNALNLKGQVQSNKMEVDLNEDDEFDLYAENESESHNLENDFQKLSLKPNDPKIIQELSSQGTVQQDQDEDILLCQNFHFDKNVKKSLTLEEVITKQKSSPDKRITAKVVSILTYSPSRKSIVGVFDVATLRKFLKSFQKSEFEDENKSCKNDNFDGSLLFTPIDMRYPKMIVHVKKLSDELKARLVNGDISLSTELMGAELFSWKQTSRFPHGLIIDNFGESGDIESETAAIIFKHSIQPVDFDQEVLDCLPSLPWTIPDEEHRNRKDLRNLRIFTIDPVTARDLDDALSIEKLPNGNFRVGVHIADVSYFVPPNSALDMEARNRSTSVYLVQKVLPMLPRELCENLCSLNPGVDRLCFSVLWEMDSDANVCNQWIGRTIIRSCCKLAYDHAQEMLDEKFPEEIEERGVQRVEKNKEIEENEENFSSRKNQILLRPKLAGQFKWNEVAEDVRGLWKLASVIRQKRFDSGALKLDKVKLLYSLDDDMNPYDFRHYITKESNSMIEEFMLLANKTVARVISSAFPSSSLLRRHSPPNERKLKQFEEFCTKQGYYFDPSSSLSIQQSLKGIQNRTSHDPVLFDLFHLHVTKPMQLAQYFCSGEYENETSKWVHYALNIPYYTHFTSPIRRYPDVIVHRLLSAVLEAEEKITQVLRKMGVSELEVSGGKKSFVHAKKNPILKLIHDRSSESASGKGKEKREKEKEKESKGVNTNVTVEKGIVTEKKVRKDKKEKKKKKIVVAENDSLSFSNTVNTKNLNGKLDPSKTGRITESVTISFCSSEIGNFGSLEKEVIVDKVVNTIGTSCTKTLKTSSESIEFSGKGNIPCDGSPESITKPSSFRFSTENESLTQIPGVKESVSSWPTPCATELAVSNTAPTEVHKNSEDNNEYVPPDINASKQNKHKAPGSNSLYVHKKNKNNTTKAEISQQEIVDDPEKLAQIKQNANHKKQNEWISNGVFTRAKGVITEKEFPTHQSLTLEIPVKDICLEIMRETAREKHLPDKDTMIEIARYCNERKNASKCAQEASEKVFLCVLLKQIKGVVSDARVMAVGPKFMSVYVCEFGIEKIIYFSEIDGVTAEWFNGTGTLVLDFAPEDSKKEKSKDSKNKSKSTQNQDSKRLRNSSKTSLIAYKSEIEALKNENGNSSNSPMDDVDNLLLNSMDISGELCKGISENDEIAIMDDAILNYAVSLSTYGEAETRVEAAVLPLTLRTFSSLPVYVYATGGGMVSLDIGVKLYVDSYLI